jgi:hypothetical protein
MKAKRQGPVRRLEGRSPAGTVAVQAHHRLAAGAPQQLQLILGDRRAQRGDTMFQPGPRQRDDVQITLRHDQAANVLLGIGRRLARLGIAVEDRALVEDRRLRRVEIFRPRLFGQRPSAKRHQPPARIMDGEHDAVAETVIGRAIVRLDQQAAFDEIAHRRPRRDQLVLQPGAAVRGKADAEALAVLAVETAAFQIAPRRFAPGAEQGALEMRLRGLHPFHQRLAVNLLFCGLRVRLRQAQPRLPGQTLGRLHEGQALDLFQPGEDIAMLARGKAVVKSLVVIDEEGGRAFLLERGQADKLAALAFQLHGAADQVRRADPRLDLVDEIVIQPHENASARLPRAGARDPARQSSPP